MARKTVDGFQMPPFPPNEPEDNLSDAEMGHSEADCVIYPMACRKADAKICASRTTMFYRSRLLEVAGDQKATWLVAKDLLQC